MRETITIICVPTPINEIREPDLGYILSAVEEVGKYFKSGSTIILESTTYPGTTEEVVKRMLEKTGKEFYLGYSPERIDPGNTRYPLEKIPKIVSGINKEISYKMTKHVAELIKENTDEHSKILILGVAYKRDIPDTRNSPARLILEELNRDRRRIDYFDPFVDEYEGLKSVEPSDLNLNEYKCVVLLTDHNEFRGLDFGNYKGVLIDTRNFINASNLKCKYIGIGKGNGNGKGGGQD